MNTITGQLSVRSANANAPTRFARQDHFPQGWQTCVAQFLELFHRYGYIYKPMFGDSWYSANEKWKLLDSEILKAIACAHPKFFLGCRAGKSTRFAVLDIDQKSRYHNKKSLEKLLHVLSDAGLSRSSLYRSSYSGGWHLYLFFDEPVNSAELRKQLLKLLSLHSFQITKGQLEIFPHPGEDGSLGLGLRLPLQPGFAWLDKETLDVEHDRCDLNATKALELFVDALDGDANPYAAFRSLKAHVQELEQRREESKNLAAEPCDSNVIPMRSKKSVINSGEFGDVVKAVFHKLPPGIIVDNWYKGRLYHLNGLTGPSQRAEAIECLGHYLFYGDPSRDLPALGYGYEQEREWAIREFLTARHNGQSNEINRDRADAFAQVQRAANWRPANKQSDEPKKYKAEQPIAWIRANANRKTMARKRISEALDSLKKRGRSFTTVELQESAGCSRETLYKHDDIWRRDYEDLSEGFFEICTDEYNVVVGAVCSENKLPATPSTKVAPPGLLAARRVAYEISMRRDRAINRSRRQADEERDDLEATWSAKVAALTESNPDAQSVRELKALLTVLAAYLAMAPNEEGQLFVQERMRRIRNCLSQLEEQPLQVVRPPPEVSV